MPKRLATLAATVLLLALLPVASATAASPWWQILDGSRPSNLWEPSDKVQEIESQISPLTGGLGAQIKVNGSVIGCLAAGSISGLTPEPLTPDQVCQFLGAPEATETAAELEALLEGAFGTSAVEVTGGPAGGDPFIVTTPGGTPAIELFVPEAIFGTATAKVIDPGGSGRLILTVTNLGNAPVDATETPVRIVDELPEGVVAEGVEALGGYTGAAGPVDCAIEAADRVECAFEGELPPYEAIEIDILVSLTGSPPAAGAPGTVAVSGGNAPPKSLTQEIVVSPEEVEFGIERFSAEAEEEGGDPVTQAGKHPFQLTTTIQLNAGDYLSGPTRAQSTVEQPAMARNLRFPLPAGLVGNATAVPACRMADFFELPKDGSCPAETAIGVASVTIHDEAILGFARLAVPLYNLPPANGEPARFGFFVEGTPVVIGTAVDPDDRYRIVASVNNATQIAKVLSSTVVIWGSPGDPRHDESRGWGCMKEGVDLPPCERPPTLGEEAFLRQPVSCDGPLGFGAEVEPWNVPLGSVLDRASFEAPGLHGCNQVPFDPEIAAAPSSKLAANPTGLEFRLDMPNSGLADDDAIAEGQPKKVKVTLPEGMTVNPSQAEGLATCSPADYARERFDSAPGEGCPDASKIGEVQVSTPLLEEEARGALYIAKPKDNPFGSLIALYLVAKIPERGILIKQAGKVEPHPRTGQLVTTFDDIPQLPFSSFKLRFREGGRAPLVTPPGCGTFETVAEFTPWSASDPDNPQPSEIVTRTSSFTIQRGVDGGGCPSGGTPPFDPGFEAGSVNPAAGKYSPFYMRLTRKDGEQDLTKFSATLPEGALAKLAGVGQCPQAAVEAAKGRDGLDEKANPSCPAGSHIGRTTVGAGVGSILTYVPGQLYLGGPYKGAPLSVVSITPAVAGPFDVGTVVVQVALRIDPRTGVARVDGNSSDPIPHILAGIPLKVRDVRVYVDRPEFTTTPTSCDPMDTKAEIFGSGADVFNVADDVPAAPSARYQAANCANLGFKPRLAIRLKGGTKRGQFPALRAVLRPRPGDANLSRAVVKLPRSAFLEQSHIRTICTRVQWAQDACPKGSIYGKVSAFTPLLEEPLRGNAYLRSSDNKLPDLVFDLEGLVDIEAAARIDSVRGGIRATFPFVPDAPLTKVVVEMRGGKKGLIVNSRDLCRTRNRAGIKLAAHNGRTASSAPLVRAQCRKARKRAAKRRGRTPAGRGARSAERG